MQNKSSKKWMIIEINGFDKSVMVNKFNIQTIQLEIIS